MATSSNKHGGRATVVRMNSFIGGLALDRPSELLEINELAQADNFHFDVTSGALQTVPGLRPRHVADGPLRSIFWSTLFGRWLFVIDNALYSSVMEINDEDESVFGDSGSVFGDSASVYTGDKKSQNIRLGVLSGASEPCFAEFGGVVCIASGGSLQVWDGEELKTVNAYKPDGETELVFDLIFSRDSRLNGSKSGDDIVYQSSVGDPTDWTWAAGAASKDEDLSKAQWFQVGYRDSAHIVAMGVIAKDLVVCKRTADGSPIVYRVTGSVEEGNLFPYEVNRTSDVYNSRCLVQASNDLYYFGSDGFQSFTTVQQYGDIKMADVGRKVNVFLARQGNLAAKMWLIRPFAQLWIQPSRGKDIYIYHYAIGAFTVRRFFDTPAAIHVVGDMVYVAIGNRVLTIDSNWSIDSWSFPLNPIAKTSKFRGRNAYVVKGLTSKTSGEDELDAEIRVGPINLPLRSAKKGRLIYGNADLVYGNVEKIYSGSRQTGTTQRKANVRLEEWQLALLVKSGKMTLDAVEIDVVEVN